MLWNFVNFAFELSEYDFPPQQRLKDLIKVKCSTYSIDKQILRQRFHLPSCVSLAVEAMSKMCLLARRSRLRNATLIFEYKTHKNV